LTEIGSDFKVIWEISTKISDARFRETTMTDVNERRHRAMNFVPDPSEAPFTDAEYAERRARLRAAMDKSDVDLLYLTSPEAVYYLTGYSAIWYQTLGLAGWEPISGVALHRDSGDLIHIECDREQALTNLTTIAHDLRIWPLGQGDFLTFIIDQLDQAGWLGGTTALELSHYRPYPAASNRMCSAFQARGCTIEDATPIINAVRRLKSSQELAYVRKAADICDIGMRAAIEHARPGITELELFGEIMLALAKAGGENPGITLPVQSGHRTIASHAAPSRRVIEPGDTLNIDVCGVYNRYHSDNARTFSIGEPDPEIAKLVALSAEAFAIIDQTAKPGLPLNDLMKPLEDHYKAAGIWGSQRWTGGYELGCAVPPDWVGSFDYTVGEDSGDAVLEPGLVVNYESNFYLPGRPGMSMLIDTLVVDEESAGLVHHIPHQIIVIG
jgi:Xaa-Pro dipeptidase